MNSWRVYHCTGVDIVVTHNQLAVETGFFPQSKKYILSSVMGIIVAHY
jgi:hypothetical protein